MALLFYIIGALATFAFIINNLWYTIRRKQDVSFREMLLAFFAALMPITALLVDNLSEARFDVLEELLFLLIIPLLITHIGLTIIDLVRPKRRRSGRGVLGVGIAILLLLATVGFNLSSQFIAFTRDEVVVRPTPINNVASAFNQCDQAVLGTQILDILLKNIAIDAGLDEEELLERFVNNGETTFGELVRANGQDPNQTVDRVVNEFRQFIAETAAACPQAGEEQINSGSINVIALFVRSFLLQAIEWPFDEFMDNSQQMMSSFAGAGGNDNEAEDTEETVIQATPNSVQLQETRAALVAAIPTVDVAPTATPTTTPTITPSYTPTVTRTPIATFSPTPTRQPFVTTTPSATATLPNPCIATTSYNVNMRDVPNLEDSEVVQTIPFETIFTVYGPNDDQTWWYGQYEDVPGWVSIDYIRLTQPCYDLPTYES
ncbi:SH3 domain-containing protein [Phototrophicus methaneseepsis]|uniref:SH3 domain-containing protein n=1 Tax=Phototrophicus methaneseepsis TaxID=2710758 RepID=A0A7S8ECH8_9CHLR|nr:SH3 domain-containing protein [Phototrophicus methaneseepsis]QPC84430.1 SH3 domain-containing protein [Phototrophicus methaneseepsis]